MEENDYLGMLNEVLKASGWSQEQLASRLGVTFASVNSWLNGRNQPRGSMQKKIRRLYLAKDADEVRGVYVTVVFLRDYVRAGDILKLERDLSSDYDDEAVRAELLDDREETDREDDCYIGRQMQPEMFVANSVRTVARGTYSAGRICDKIRGEATARVEFICHKCAIAKIIDWGDGQGPDLGD